MRDITNHDPNNFMTLDTSEKKDLLDAKYCEQYAIFGDNQQEN